jgi:hypothetical protein
MAMMVELAAHPTMVVVVELAAHMADVELSSPYQWHGCGTSLAAPT